LQFETALHPKSIRDMITDSKVTTTLCRPEQVRLLCGRTHEGSTYGLSGLIPLKNSALPSLDLGDEMKKIQPTA
jgi:hypothetical protein